MAKKVVIDMGNYIPRTEEYDAMRWCINNGIKVYPRPLSTVKWSLIIEINGKTTESPEGFGKMVIWQKLFEYYLYYYKKYENNI
jgi:hypothetical protein